MRQTNNIITRNVIVIIAILAQFLVVGISHAEPEEDVYEVGPAYGGGTGQNYNVSCTQSSNDIAFKGGAGQAYSSTCPISEKVFTYLYLGGKGQNYYMSCSEPFKDSVFKGGSGQGYSSTCPIGDATFAYLYLGGKGQNYYMSCTTPFEDIVFKGGKGQAYSSTCPIGYTTFAYLYLGGAGQSYANGCTFSFKDIAYVGGIGQSSYTTCPTNFYSITSKGGIGQSYNNSCMFSFKDVAYVGGIGQSFATTCPTNLSDIVSRGGIGQTFATSCPANFLSYAYRGGIGQSFATTCNDITSLFINKTVANPISCKGKTNVFTISITNKEHAIYKLENITVRDSLELGLTYKNWSATVGSFDPTTGVWSVPSIDKDETHTLTIEATSSLVGIFKNMAWITAASKKAFIRDTVAAAVDSKLGSAKQGDIRTQVYPKPYRNIDLTAYLSPLLTSADWQTVSGPPINTQGVLNTVNFSAKSTYIYSVKTQDECSSDELTAYLTVMSDTYPNKNDVRTITVCHNDDEVVNLNNVLGLDGNGDWTVEPIAATPHLTTAANGAKLYNVKDAYADNSIPLFNHNGGTNNAKQIKLYYKINAAGTALHNKVYTVVLIISDQIMP